MYCWNCGAQIPDESIFCFKCGKTQKQVSQNDEVKEPCEIVSEKVADGGIFSGDRFKFWAKAIGPNGQYSAGESKVFTGYYGGHYSYPDKDNKENQEALESLVNWLVKDGWEATGDRGSEWWNIRFRRRYIPQDEPLWETCEITFEKRTDLLTGDLYWFLAKAKGRDGEYLAGKTKEIPAGTRSFSAPQKNNRLAVATHKVVVEQLLKDGWELIDNQPPNWWNNRFRRRIQTQVNVQSKKALNQEEAIWLSIKTYYKHAYESWLKIPAIAELKKHLATEELPEGVIFGQHPDTGVGGGGLWATNKRLLYVGLTFWKKPVIIEYSYSQVSSIDFANDQIILHYANKQTPFKGVDKLAQVSDFIRFVQSKIT